MAWLGKTESTYHQPRPGMRYEKNATLASLPPKSLVYEPQHFADGEACYYKVRVVKGILTLPAGKVTFRANKIDQNGTALWKFTLEGGAIGGRELQRKTSVAKEEQSSEGRQE